MCRAVIFLLFSCFGCGAKDNRGRKVMVVVAVMVCEKTNAQNNCWRLLFLWDRTNVCRMMFWQKWNDGTRLEVIVLLYCIEKYNNNSPDCDPYSVLNNNRQRASTNKPDPSDPFIFCVCGWRLIRTKTQTNQFRSRPFSKFGCAAPISFGFAGNTIIISISIYTPHSSRGSSQFLL